MTTPSAADARRTLAAFAAALLLTPSLGCGEDPPASDAMNMDATVTEDTGPVARPDRPDGAEPDIGALDAALIPDAISPPMDATIEDMARPRLDAVIDAAPRVDAACECEGNQICVGADCIEPDICETHRDCLGARICEEGMCRDGCVRDADCPDMLTCDIATQTCTDQGPCMSDDQCGDGICVDNVCAPPCAGADDCPGNQACDGNTGRCLEPLRCVNDDDCSADRLCQAGQCIDPCQDNANCRGAQRCERGVCVEPDVCNDDRDCTGDRRCVGAAMEAACQDPCTIAGCDRELACDPETGRCGEADPCENALQCFENRVCVDGLCDAPCLEPADCAGAQDCVEGACVEPQNCNSNLDCLGGRVCNQGACEDHCENLGCPGLLLCERETGRCAEAAPCLDDTACFEGRICEGQVCDDPCLDFTDCTGSQDCVEGRCVEPAVCRGPFDCLEGRRCVDRECIDECVNGLCAGTRVCDADDVCVEGPDCAADRDCDGDRLCHPILGSCADPCAERGDCRDGFECGADGLCRPPRFCADDDHCAEGLTCAFATCRAVTCEGHDACPEDQMCVDFACADALPDQCECPEGYACADGHCVQPGPCAPAGEGGAAAGCPADHGCADTGHCVQCQANAHCAPGVCVDGRCANPEACDDDAGCLPGHVCRRGTCTFDRDSCDEDTLENNDFGFAIPLPQVSISGLSACQGAADWYRIEDPVGSRVTVRFDPATTQLDLAAFVDGAVGADPLDAGSPIGGELWVNTGPGRYLIRVSARRGGSGTYSIVAEGNVACIDDVNERPWRNDVADRATSINAGQISGTVCGGDVDHFFYDGADGAVTIDIAGNVNATINGQAPPAQVEGEAAIEISGDGPYTLSVAPDDSPAARCERAPLVPLNATFQVERDRGVDAFAPPCHDRDRPDQVFAFETPVPGVVSARMTSLGAGTSLILYNEACSGEPIACGDALGDVTAAVGAGSHRLLVDGAYVGEIALDFEPENADCADAPELVANGDTAVALGVRNPEIAGGCLDAAPGQAVFTFDVDEPSMVSIAVDSDDPEARVSIRAVCSSPLGEIRCYENGGRLRAQHLLAGRYTAVFQGAEDITARLEIEPGGHFGPPTPQEACEAAPAILADGPVPAELDEFSEDSFQPACRGPGDNDQVFRIDVDAASDFSAVLDAPAPTTSLLLYSDCAAEPLDCGDFNGELHGQLEPGTYYIVMDGGNVGQLTASLTPLGGGQLADSPAEACADAEPIEHGIPAPAAVGNGRDNFAPACRVPGDAERVFRIELDRRATINAALTQADPTTSLLLYSDCEDAPVACGDENGEIHQRMPAGTYYIVVDGRSQGDLLVELDPPPGAPAPETPGEACAGAPGLQLGENAIRVSPGADDIFAPACVNPDNADGVYEIDVPQRAVVRAALTAPAAAANMLLYGDCDAEPVACPGPDATLQQQVEAGRYYLVVDGAYDGGLDLAFDAVAECGVPSDLPVGVDTLIETVPGAAAFNGGCLLGTDAQGLYGFELAQPANVRLTTTSISPVMFSIRRVCDDAGSEVSCEDGDFASFEGPLEAGRYVVIFEGLSDITARLEVVQDGGDDQLVNACAPAAMGEILPAGTQLSLEGSTAGAGDDFNAPGCGGGIGPGASDQVFLFGLDAPRRVTATVRGAAFAPVVMLLDGGCLGAQVCSPANDPTISAALPAGQHAVVVDAGLLGDEGAYTLDLEVE